MRVENLQTNFAAGVFSPSLKQRRDLQGYYQALQECVRMMVLPQGGVSRDGGFEYCGTTKDDDVTNVALIDWRFANDAEQCYMLEFGARYIRVFWGYDRRPILQTTPSRVIFTGSGLNDLTVSGSYLQSPARTFTIAVTVEGSGDTPDHIRITSNHSGDAAVEMAVYDAATEILMDGHTGIYLTFGARTGHTLGETWQFSIGYPYEIPTPYESSEVNNIRVTQRGDVMYLYHENHPLRKLIRYDHADWELQVVAAKSARWLGRESAVRWKLWDTTANSTNPGPINSSQLDYKFSAQYGSVLVGEGIHSGSIGWSSQAGWYETIPSYLLELIPSAKQFAIEYEGTLYVDAAEDYRFSINCGMGGDLSLDGALIKSWCDTVHNAFNPNDGNAQAKYASYSASITLTAGEHSFRLRTYNTNSTKIFGIALAWKRASESDYSLIPGSQFVKRSESAEVTPAEFTVYDVIGFGAPATSAEMDDVCDTTLSGITVNKTGVWDDRVYYHSNADDPVDPFPTTTALGDVDRPPLELPNGSSFALSIEGWIYIATAGSYTFGVDSNDASDFIVYDSDPASYLAAASKYGAGGCSATFEAGWATHNSGAVTLTAGWKRFRARTFNLGWGHGFGVGWLTPDEPTTWRPVPRTVLTAGAIDGYPQMGIFHEGRHWLFRDITLWASKSGQPEDFEIGADAGDAMELQLDTRRVDEIVGCETLKGGLTLFTSGGVLTVSSGGQGVITPENRMQEEEVSTGSAFIAPTRIGNSTFFVGKDRKSIYEMKYVQNRMSQTADDITVLCSHYFDSPIAKIVYQAKAIATALKTQCDLLWALTEDGGLYCMTYDEVNQVYAWHDHSVSGAEYQSIAATVGVNGEELYAAIKRTGIARTIECLNPDRATDCGVVLEDELTPVAEHLASQEVQIRWGDSADSIEGWTTDTLDSDGEGTALDLDAAPDYMEIGLPVEWSLKTMPLEKQYQSGGTSAGKTKRWIEAAVQAQKTTGTIEIQRVGGTLNYRLLSESTTEMNQELSTIMLGHDVDAVLEISGSDPAPVTILSLRGKLEIER